MEGRGGKGNESKNKQVRLHQMEHLLHSKWNHEQNENATYFFESQKSVKDLMSRLRKELVTTQHQISSNLISKWAEEQNNFFLKKIHIC